MFTVIRRCWPCAMFRSVSLLHAHGFASRNITLIFYLKALFQNAFDHIALAM